MTARINAVCLGLPMGKYNLDNLSGYGQSMLSELLSGAQD